MLSLLFILFIFLETVVSQDICNIRVTNSDLDSSLSLLHNYCSSDEICSYYFNQRSDTINETVFELLALPIFTNAGRDLNYVIDSLCSIQTNEDLIKYLWIRELVYRRSTNIVFCGPSQTLKINGDNSVNCICSPEADCEEAGTNDSLLITMLVLLIVSTFVLLVMFICNNQYFVKFVDMNK